jgi:hypothetical protein
MAKSEVCSSQRNLLLWRGTPPQLPQGKQQELAEALADLLLQAALGESTRGEGAIDESEDHA